jgi:phosphate transport system substrate-binding protein
MIAVASDANNPYVLPSVESVNLGTYPIARDLYMYTAAVPSGRIKEYMDWIFSAEAQAIVREQGFVPVNSP